MFIHNQTKHIYKQSLTNNNYDNICISFLKNMSKAQNCKELDSNKRIKFKGTCNSNYVFVKFAYLKIKIGQHAHEKSINI